MVKDRAYLIRWKDHFSTDGWFDKEDVNVEEVLEFSTVGFFIEENEHYYHLARTVGTDQYADIMSILKNQVTHIQQI